MYLGNRADLKGLVAGKLFHDPEGRSTLADTNLFDIEPIGFIDNSIQNQFCLGGITHESTEIDGLKKT